MTVMPSELPFRTNRLDALKRLVREDIAYWAGQPRKKSLVRQAGEIVDLWRRYRFAPYYYLKHDLYLREAGDTYRDYIPSILADRYVYVINPKDCIDWLEDKLQFDERMAAAGLPHVRTLATLTRAQSAVSAIARDGARLGMSDLWRLAREQGHVALFVKPRFGLGGEGAFKLNVEEDGFGRDGVVLSEAALATKLSETAYAEFLVQPYFAQHPALKRINPTSVNTLRILTLRTDDSVEIIASYLRVGAGASETDNGSHGGYSAHADLQTGAVGRFGRVHLTFAKSRGAEIHPATGVAFGSVRLPHVEAVVDLVTRGARAFAPLRVIGWDVAIGPDGPAAIEANSIPGFRPVQDVCGGLRRTGYGEAMAAHYGWR